MVVALSELNEIQRQAVENIDGPVLVVAGAGSGKTRVITTRIANLLERGVSPYQILAMTFTNKAAQEMKSRVEQALGGDRLRDLTITTFHTFCARFLRREIDYLDRLPNFAIFDTQDTIHSLKRVIREMDLPEKDYPAARFRHHFSRMKNTADGDFPAQEGLEHRIFEAYQEELRAQNALDFDDLLLFTCQILERIEECRSRYRQRFRYIMVDEYQDTNRIQAKLIRLLLNEERNICVVGDEDQSIYGWRGAEIRNILDFEEAFQGAAVFKLEQNYRSTQQILDYANKVIERNQLRKPKALWTAAETGEPIEVRDEMTAYRESERIVQTIVQLKSKHGLAYSDFAVLFRSNFLSRIPEEMFRKYQIPYQLIGGLKFYDRKEIKDLLAYMRIVVNPRDWTSFVRAVGVPSRGVGSRSLDALYRLFSQRKDLPAILDTAIDSKLVAGKALAGLKEFRELYRWMLHQAETLAPARWLADLIKRLDYIDYLEKSDEGSVENRAANIEELVASMQELEEQGVTTLAQFMDYSALVSDQDDIDETKPRVNLMTIHAAKGLEFDTVFIMGLEEGVFPNKRSLDSHPDAMEEERRLFYVAITRAKRRLYLSFARKRQTYGSANYNQISPFLVLTPPPFPGQVAGEDDEFIAGRAPKRKVKLAELADQVNRIQAQLGERGVAVDFKNMVGDRVSSARQSDSSDFRPGDVVRHPTFGMGTVSSIRGSGGFQTVSVYFPGRGVKKLMLSQAKLDKIQ